MISPTWWRCAAAAAVGWPSSSRKWPGAGCSRRRWSVARRWRQQGGGRFAVGSHYDAVRMQKVLDCGALAQKLGVGDDIEEAAGNPVTLDGAADPLVGVDRTVLFSTITL